MTYFINYYSNCTQDSPQLAGVLRFYGHPIPQEAGKSVQALDASVGVYRQIIVLILKVDKKHMESIRDGIQ